MTNTTNQAASNDNAARPVGEGSRATYAYGELSIDDITARMRQDVKASKALKGCKVSVRKLSCTHTWSIEVRITYAPFEIYNDEQRAEWLAGYQMGERGLRGTEGLTPEAAAALEAVEQIQATYNYNDSDYQTDYFSVRYYGRAGFDSGLENAERTAWMVFNGKRA